jgi:hypothetical protein
MKPQSPDESGAGVQGPISDYLLERLAAGDLPASRAASLHARVARDPDARARLARLAASSAEILQEHPPAIVVEEIRRRFSNAPSTSAGGSGRASVRGRPWLSFGVPALALVGALVLTIRGTGWWPVHGLPTRALPGSESTGDTLKGLRPSLRVYRKAAGRIERLRDGAPTRPGDELQLAYVAAGHRFGAVVSADGTGHVTYHLPPVAGPAVRLRTDGETVLPSAYELDAAPRFERFLFVASDEPFDATALADVASGRAAPPAGKVAVFFMVSKP